MRTLRRRLTLDLVVALAFFGTRLTIAAELPPDVQKLATPAWHPAREASRAMPSRITERLRLPPAASLLPSAIAEPERLQELREHNRKGRPTYSGFVRHLEHPILVGVPGRLEPGSTIVADSWAVTAGSPET